jgi:hypothetical protein
MRGRHHGGRMMMADVMMPVVHDVADLQRGRVRHGVRGSVRGGRHTGGKGRTGQEPGAKKGQKLGHFDSFQEMVQRSRWIAK